MTRRMPRIVDWSRAIRDRLPLSREGVGWTLLAVAMLLTGLLKSINLITLLACILLAVVLVNLALAWRQLRGLKIERMEKDLLLAGESASWPVRVMQDGVPKARLGLTVADAWGDVVLDVEQRQEQVIERIVHPPGRGSYPLAALVVRSGHPFGLVELERTSGTPAIVHVAPRIGRIQRGMLRHWLSRRSPNIGAIRSTARRHSAGQTEFHGLRPFRHGDSPRLIHWRTSARRGELMIREFEVFPNDDLVMIVDLSQPKGSETNEAFERMLSLAATIAWEWCRQKSDWLTVVIAGRSVCRFSGPTGNSLRSEILLGLAAAQSTAEIDVASALTAIHEKPALATSHLLVSLGVSSLEAPLREHLQTSLATVDVSTREESEFFEPANGSTTQMP